MLSSLVHICAIYYQREAWPRRHSLGLWCPSAVVIINANSWWAKNSRDLAWCHHTTPRGCGKTSRAACIGPHIGCLQTGPYRMWDQAIERECVRPVKGVRGTFLHLPQISMPCDARPSNQGLSRASHSTRPTTCMHTCPHMSLNGGDAWFGDWRKWCESSLDLATNR